MEKLFYTVKDIQEMLEYSETKAYTIIKQLNTQMEMEAKEKKEIVFTFPGRINKQYFEKKVGIERG